MSYSIAIDDLSSDAIAELLAHHLEVTSADSPPESCHALDLNALRKSSISFFSAREANGELLGCGAISEIDATHGEIKSMHTLERARRRGVAAALLERLLDVARSRGYTRVSLETGSMEAFAPARALYERYGFTECGPFEGYVEDPYSTFMTLALVSA